MTEKLWFLKSCELFMKLDGEQIAKLEAHSRVRNVARNSPIYMPNDPADYVFLLASGRVRICHLTPEGKQAILAFVDPGELFGELAIVDEGSVREEFAEAVERSTVVMIPQARLKELMEVQADLTIGITKVMGLRRRRIERRLKHLLFRSNRERLSHLLLDLAEQYGIEADGGVALRVKLSHQEMANIIGSTRETVTVVLGELQNEDLVKTGRRKLLLTNIQKLADSVQRPVPVPSAGIPRSVLASSKPAWS